MTEEWFTICKDCGARFGYSAEAERRLVTRGLSRPERCGECRQRHGREIRTLGLTHLELRPLAALPQEGLAAGALGRLVRAPREHTMRRSEGNYDFGKFAIKDQHIEEFFALLDMRQVCVIVAPTGAGKSTLLPYRLMVPPASISHDMFTRRGQILVTQPRIQATRNIPHFVATRLHGSNLGPGFDVGFRHSGTPHMDRSNKLVYVTDGTLINMIVRNELPLLGVVMIDEAHERSLNIDLILGLLKRQLPRFPHLRLIIASATIDAEKFVEFFGGKDSVGFYEFPGGRPHVIDVRYRDGEAIPLNKMPTQMPSLVADKVLALLRGMDEGLEKEGDILAFLHGERPILRAVTEIRDEVDADRKLAGRVDVLPLFTSLPQFDQDAALRPRKDPTRRRVVVSTNVAETSLTVDGIVHVVDSGLINRSEWDPATHTTFVATTRHSRAGCRQRWGRAGRQAPGVAHCLYTESQFNDDTVFAPYSQPEIQRAPLEQVILTAKAAGVNDVQTFPWIEAPPVAELGRAPEVLQRIGALDGDGDLTQHGIELRSFAEEPDISNLMILADRFGCATEMATILAMRRLRSLRELFQWNRTWDGTTKLKVHQRQQALMAACRDDLEFSLKLWEAWEGTLFLRNKNAQRRAWAEQNFVSHETLDRRVSADRDALLNGLSGHKKDDEARPTDFRLLNKLRILIAHGLPTHLYRRAAGVRSGVACFVPFLETPEHSPHLVALHENAVVSVSHDSVCGQRPPDAFVCARRRRWLERRSPLKEPSIRISASFIIALEEEWLKTGNLSWPELAHYIASVTRSCDGALKGEAIPMALFADQYFPIGSKVKTRNVAGILRIERIVTPPPKIFARRRGEDAPDVTDSIESDDADQDPFDIAAVSSGIWTDWQDEDGLPPVASPRCSKAVAFEARVESGEAVPDGVTGLVCGFDLSDSNPPVARLTVPMPSSPFEQFSRRFRVGDEISVEVVSIERFLQERLVYLVVREPESKCEMVLDPHDVSLMGRNFALESRLAPGDRIIVSVDQIAPPPARNEPGQVRVTRLRFSVEASQDFLKGFDGKMIEAQIADVGEEGISIWLNPDAPASEEAVGAFVPTWLLPDRPEQMTLGERCRVIARRRVFTGRRSLCRTLGSAPEEFIRIVKGCEGLKWDADRGVVELRGPVAWEERAKLRAAAGENGTLVEVVDRLFRTSYELDVVVIDVQLFKDLGEAIRLDKQVETTVVGIERDGIVVSLRNGGRCYVSRRELPIPQSGAIGDFAPVGTGLAVWVRELDMGRNRILLSALEFISFRIPNDKIALLIGRGGASVKRLQEETGASINISRGGNEVRVSGKDRATVRNAVEAIEDQINQYSATVRLNPSCVRFLFYSEARIMNLIRLGLNMRIDVGRGSDNRNTGLVSLLGGKFEDFETALHFIREADPDAAFVVSPHRAHRITPEVSTTRRAKERAAAGAAELDSAVAQMDKTQAKAASAPVAFARIVVMTEAAVQKLMARPMGFFKTLFGGESEKSIVERVAGKFAVKIVAQSHRTLEIVGISQGDVERAEIELRQAAE